MNNILYNKSGLTTKSPYIGVWVLFFLFMALLMFKTMLFHISTGNSLLISSILHAPYEFVMFWGGKIIPILFLAGIVFVTKRYLWTIVVSFLIDIWGIAQLFYYKANAFLSLIHI